VALGGEVVDLVGPDELQGLDQRRRVDEVAVVQVELIAHLVDAPGVERAGAPHEAVDLVSLGEQELGEVAAVLAGDAGDECFFHRSL
jgi:hypothetical protein